MCSVPIDVCIETQNKTETSKTDVTDENKFEESSTADANPLEITSVVRNAQYYTYTVNTINKSFCDIEW